MKASKRSAVQGTTQAARPARRGKNGRGMTVAALALALGTAVYLNWSFARSAPTVAADETAADAQAVQTAADADTEPQAVFDPLTAETPTEGESANKNYGEAQLVSVNKDTGTEFFEQARLGRAKARDEALESIEKALKRANLTDAEKTELTAALSAQVSSAAAESDLETIIRAKGFADCVVVLSQGSANVTVMTENDALTAEEVTRIRDAVLSKCSDLRAQDITVVEVK